MVVGFTKQLPGNIGGSNSLEHRVERIGANSGVVASGRIVVEVNIRGKAANGNIIHGNVGQLSVGCAERRNRVHRVDVCGYRREVRQSEANQITLAVAVFCHNLDYVSRIFVDDLHLLICRSAFNREVVL